MNSKTNFDLSLFFTYSLDLLAIVGPDGYFKRTNPAFQIAMGYTEEELLAQPISYFLHPDDVPKTKKRIEILASGVPTISSINRYRCKDGIYRWFSWNTNSVGKLFYSIGRDISAQVEAEGRSEAQIQQLQKMDAVGRLAGGIAHDFNNMLAAISLYCDMLTDDIDPQTVQDRVQSIRKTTDRAAALTRQLLVFSRKQIVQLRNVDLNELFKQLQNMLVRLIGENVKIESELDPGLNSVKVDPSQMEQVLLNLIVNARDALPGSGTITVKTKNVFLQKQIVNAQLSVEPGHYVVLSVADNGCGMNSETIRQIFEPFFTTKPVGKGTGLGLATTYGIIKQCKGTIGVESEPGRGTLFQIYLPSSAGSTEVIEPAQSLTPTAATGGRTVLLVEDDQGLREGFATVLRKRNYEVLEAEHAAAAIEILEHYRKPVHLLLTDVVMPGISGFELARQVVSKHKDLKVIYMSGYTDTTFEAGENANLPSFEFIQKPFASADLLERIQKVLADDSVTPA